MFSFSESIEKYQNYINKTNSRIDYAVGIGLYLIPADTVLKMGSLEHYNNAILVADDNVKIGLNEELNHLSNIAVNKITPNQVQDLHATPQVSEINNVYLAIGFSTMILLIFLF
jgi:hypothetical protein